VDIAVSVRMMSIEDLYLVDMVQMHGACMVMAVSQFTYSQDLLGRKQSTTLFCEAALARADLQLDTCSHLGWLPGSQKVTGYSL